MPIVKCLTLPDKFQDHATQQEQLEEAELDHKGILKKIRSYIKLANIPKSKNQTKRIQNRKN